MPQKALETEVRYGIELHAAQQKELDLGVRQMVIKIPVLPLTSLWGAPKSLLDLH